MVLRRPGRKLLVASLGVAAVNYAYSCSNGTTNVDGGAKDAPMEAIVANLAPPPPDGGMDAKGDGAGDATDDVTGDAPSDAMDAGNG